MDVREACRIRAIGRLGVTTPLLVPSFSSLGFPDVGETHGFASTSLFEVSLVSAYDIYRGVLREPDIYATDLVLLDSGGYEARGTSDPLEPYFHGQPPQTWVTGNYETVLQRLQPLSAVLIVNFDYTAPRPLDDQIREAKALFARYPAFAGDFLCKPTAEGPAFVEVDDVLMHVEELSDFDVIGFTEKELGCSLLERCRNLVQIRRRFHECDHSTPIHVFGSLDPGTMLAYFLCGADIFDGLTWLRFSFRDGTPTYHVTGIVADGTWAMRDEDVIRLHRVDNLRWLDEQQRLMRGFAVRHVAKDMGGLRPLLDRVVPLVRAAGVVMEE